MNTVDNKEKNELIIPVEQTCYNKIMARSRKQRETIKILQWALMILSLLLVFCIWDITFGKSDEEYEAELLQLVEQNAVLQTRVEELKAQNKALQAENDEATYPLTEAQRELISGIVMAEAGGQGYIGQVLVAQCIRNACEIDGIDPETAIKRYKYAVPKSNVSDEVRTAVSDVFDLGLGYTDEPIVYFYAPGVVSSKWHESQDYVLTHKQHKFFSRKGQTNV